MEDNDNNDSNRFYSIGCWLNYSKFSEHLEEVSTVGKTLEVTPGTLDIKSRPMRCQKGLWLQLMCCAPFRLLSQDFRTGRMEYQREGQSCLE